MIPFLDTVKGIGKVDAVPVVLKTALFSLPREAL